MNHTRMCTLCGVLVIGSRNSKAGPDVDKDYSDSKQRLPSLFPDALRITWQHAQYAVATCLSIACLQLHAFVVRLGGTFRPTPSHLRPRMTTALQSLWNVRVLCSLCWLLAVPRPAHCILVNYKLFLHHDQDTSSTADSFAAHKAQHARLYAHAVQLLFRSSSIMRLSLVHLHTFLLYAYLPSMLQYQRYHVLLLFRTSI